MTIGATTSFTDQRDELIGSALENVGAVEPGAVRNSMNSTLFDAGAKALNRLVKHIDSLGKQLWRIQRRTATLAAGTATVTLGTDVLLVDDPCRYVRLGETSAMQVRQWSRDDYMVVADRTTPGAPRQFFFEQTLTATTLVLWPVPDQTGATLEYAAFTRGADFTSGSDTPDFPAEWLKCLVYGLTVELAPKFMQTGLIQTFGPMYQAELKSLVDSSGEKGNLVLSPWGSWGSSGGAG